MSYSPFVEEIVKQMVSEPDSVEVDLDEKIMLVKLIYGMRPGED